MAVQREKNDFLESPEHSFSLENLTFDPARPILEALQWGVHMANKPGFYLSLTKKHPQYIAAVEALGHAVRESGPLDSKMLQLVQLAAAAAIRSEGAVHSHARRALAEGATQDEIRHALISLTSTIGFPNVTASLSWCEDVFKPAKPKSAR